MLRWLAGSSGNSSSAGGNGGGSSAGSDFIGKVLRVESHQVTVEEVIAEGVYVCVRDSGMASYYTEPQAIP